MQINPIIIVKINPVRRPEFLKASGIARIPVPKLPFSRWIIVSVFLKNIEIILMRIGVEIMALKQMIVISEYGTVLADYLLC